MRRIGVVVAVFSVVICFMAGAAEASSTLCLPRVFTPAEMVTSGVAFINPTLADATLTLRLRTAAGVTVTTTTRTLPGKNQLAISFAEIFPNITSSGWLCVDTDVDQVSGFWLTGDFSTSTDGAPLINANAGYYYPAVTYFGKTTEISIANLGSNSVTGNFRLFSASGATVASVPYSIPPLGVSQQSVAALFPAQASTFDTTPYWIGLPSGLDTNKLIATSLTTNAPYDNSAVNNTYGSTRYVFPHVVDGSAGGSMYSAPLSITNYQVTNQNVTLTLRQGSAAPVSIQRTIPALGILRGSVASLFGLQSVDGWLLLEANANIGAVLTYTDTNSHGSTSVAPQTSAVADSSLIFGHIADINPWWTGIALLNTSTLDAQVEVYAMDPTGNLIAGPKESPDASFVLPSQTKRAFLLSQLIPQTQQRNSDGGYVYIKTTNGARIHGTELFFLRNNRVYANVPATRLGGFGFNPSNTTCGSGSMSVEQVFIGDANNQPVTSFQTGDTITLNVSINNTTGCTIPITRQYRAVGPNGYVLMMTATYGDQSTGRTSRFVSVRIPTDAPAGTYTFSGTLDYAGTLASLATPFPVRAATGGTGGGSGNLRVLTLDFNGGAPLAGAACFNTFTNSSRVNAVNLLADGGAPFPNYKWTLDNLSTFPPGTTVDPETGIFHGTGSPLVRRSTPYTFTMVVSDGSKTAKGAFELFVDTESSADNTPACPSLAFSQPWYGLNATSPAGAFKLLDATQGVNYGSSIPVYIGNVDPKSLVWSIDAGALPAGLKIDGASGSIYGSAFTSAAGSTYSFRVKMTGLTTGFQAGQRITAGCGGDACPYYSITVH